MASTYEQLDTDYNNVWRQLGETTEGRDELAAVLRKANDLRPILLKQLGYVPEPVLMFCNEARTALAKVRR